MKQQPDLTLIDQVLENSVLTQADFDLISKNINWDFVIEKGRVKQALIRSKQCEKIAFVDWINFTFAEDSISDLNSDCVTDYDIIHELSYQLDLIFGFSITLQRSNGAFFYSNSYELGDNYGLVCHGGQNSTILVSINGTGLSFAKDDWRGRLYWFLQLCTNATITRIDLAHDDFTPDFFTVDNMLNSFLNGGFNNGKRSPSVSQAGNWVTPDNKGRTLYIGRRTNGLFCRVYEKGLQLQSVDFPQWVRVEVEIKSVDRIVPHEILLSPQEFLAGAYPVLNDLYRPQSRVETFQHELKGDLDHRIKWGKRQSGGFLQLLRQKGMSDSEIIELLIKDDLPKSYKQKFIKSDRRQIEEITRSGSSIPHFLNE